MKTATKPPEAVASKRQDASGVRRFLSPRQLAIRWNCAPVTAQRIAENAGIAKYCLGEGRNGMVRYLLTEVEAYERERRVARPAQQ